MSDAYDSEQKERYQSYLNIHLKKEQRDLPLVQKIEALEKRGRSKWWHLAINIAALLFFGYSFYFDITQLSSTLFLIIAIVFVVNAALIMYQQKQIRELIEYLKWKMKNDDH